MNLRPLGYECRICLTASLTLPHTPLSTVSLNPQVRSYLVSVDLRQLSLASGAPFADTMLTPTFRGSRRTPWHGSSTGPPATGETVRRPATATPKAKERSAGTYTSKRAAERAANPEEAKVRAGEWHDHSRGQVTFTDYVETVWLPSKHVETSTLAAYRSYLDKHFIPTLGDKPMGKILPSHIQGWVTTSTSCRPVGRVGAEVPHHAPLDLRTSPARPGRHLQPV